MFLVLALCLLLIGFVLGVFVKTALFLVLILAVAAFAVHVVVERSRAPKSVAKEPPGRHIV